MSNLEHHKIRLISAAENILNTKKWVSLLDVFLEIQVLSPSHVKDWRSGRIRCLEQVMQGNLNRLNELRKTFHTWAKTKNLSPSITAYMSHGKNRRSLNFSKSGESHLEESYSTHYIDPSLTEKKVAKIIEKSSKDPEHVVYMLITDRVCEKCNQELERGRMLFLDCDKALCLKCAEFDELEFLPAGDAKISRRAKELSVPYAVVVKFSRARKRYERQGLLVTKKALEEAGYTPQN